MGRNIFQADIIQFWQQFNEKLETLGLKTDAKQEAEMMLNRLSIKDLIGKASASYAGLIPTKNWKLAGRSADMSVVPRRFASSANALIQSNGPVEDSGTQGTCYNCREQGHFSRECPKPRRERPKAAEGTADAASAAVDPAEADTSAVAVAALIREPAAAHLADCLLTPNVDRLLEMALLELLAGAESLPGTDLTASGTTDRLWSGVTTARCGPQAMGRPLTEAPRKGTVKPEKPMPISALWRPRKRRRFFGLRPMPTWRLSTSRRPRWLDMESSRSSALFRSSVSIGSSCRESDLPLRLPFKRSHLRLSPQLSEYL
jgi:hypothetical protein